MSLVLVAECTFNLIMVGVTFLAALSVQRSRQVFGIYRAIFGLLTGAFFVGFGLSLELFFLMRLLAYAVFAYLPLLLICSAFVFRDRRWLAGLCSLAAIVLVVIAIDAFLIEPSWLEETTYKVGSDKVAESLRIALVADLQTDDFGDYEKNALRRCMANQPDLVLLAGDYVQAKDQQAWETMQASISAFLQEIKFGAPLGAYAVQGNTDHPEWHRIFNGIGVERIKQSRAVDVSPNLRLTGLSIMDSFDRNLQVTDVESFHIVLGHAPDYSLGDIDADLLLAGHTHGGQVRLPLIGPLMTASQIPRAWAAGRTRLDDSKTLIVSRGIGMERGNSPRLRFLCRPQLVIIDIHPEPKPNP